jgi:hypothetical protein
MAIYWWVGGSGTWDATSTANWSATPGGSPGAGPPTSADDVYFDSFSGSGTVVVGGGTLATSPSCKKFSSDSSSLVFSGSGSLINCYGDFTFTNSTGSVIGNGQISIIFKGTATRSFFVTQANYNGWFDLVIVRDGAVINISNTMTIDTVYVENGTISLGNYPNGNYLFPYNTSIIYATLVARMFNLGYDLFGLQTNLPANLILAGSSNTSRTNAGKLGITSTFRCSSAANTTITNTYTTPGFPGESGILFTRFFPSGFSPSIVYFYGGGKTYNRVYVTTDATASINTISITGNNTFHSFADNAYPAVPGLAYASVEFAAGSTTTVLSPSTGELGTTPTSPSQITAFKSATPGVQANLDFGGFFVTVFSASFKDINLLPNFSSPTPSRIIAALLNGNIDLGNNSSNILFIQNYGNFLELL